MISPNVTLQDYEYSGSGTPEAARKAPKGARYIDMDGGAVYIKTTGAHLNTGWIKLGRIVGGYSAGTAYALTGTSAALDFGTTDPGIVIPGAGRWLIRASAVLTFTGATFASARVVTLKVRRTNNTAADLTSSSRTVSTGVTTTVTAPFTVLQLPTVEYTTANADDALAIFGDVAVAPTAGSLDVTSADLTAVFLGQ